MKKAVRLLFVASLLLVSVLCADVVVAGGDAVARLDVVPDLVPRGPDSVEVDPSDGSYEAILFFESAQVGMGEFAQEFEVADDPFELEAVRFILTRRQEDAALTSRTVAEEFPIEVTVYGVGGVGDTPGAEIFSTQMNVEVPHFPRAVRVTVPTGNLQVSGSFFGAVGWQLPSALAIAVDTTVETPRQNMVSRVGGGVWGDLPQQARAFGFSVVGTGDATPGTELPTYDVCIQDDADPEDVLKFNSATGEYLVCCRNIQTGELIVRQGEGTVQTLPGNALRLSTPDDEVTALRRGDGSGFAEVFSQDPILNVPLCTLEDTAVADSQCRDCRPVGSFEEPFEVFPDTPVELSLGFVPAGDGGSPLHAGPGLFSGPGDDNVLAFLTITVDDPQSAQRTDIGMGEIFAVDAARTNDPNQLAWGGINGFQPFVTTTDPFNPSMPFDPQFLSDQAVFGSFDINRIEDNRYVITALDVPSGTVRMWDWGLPAQPSPLGSLPRPASQPICGPFDGCLQPRCIFDGEDHLVCFTHAFLDERVWAQRWPPDPNFPPVDLGVVDRSSGPPGIFVPREVGLAHNRFTGESKATFLDDFDVGGAAFKDKSWFFGLEEEVRSVDVAQVPIPDDGSGFHFNEAAAWSTGDSWLTAYADPMEGTLNTYRTFTSEDPPRVEHMDPPVQGGFSGGVLNAITKSGGNDFEGTLRSDLVNDDWTVVARADSLDRVDFSPAGCVPEEQVLCLNDRRFRVEVDWETRDGETGLGQAVQLTDDTGYFWFFNAANVEMVVKVLDACGTQFDRFWVFAGGLTDVATRMRVTDTVTGLSRGYENPQRTPFQPLQDTNAFASCLEGDGEPALAAAAGVELLRVAAAEVDALASGRVAATDLATGGAVPRGQQTCQPDATTLCLNDGRFRVTVDWRTLQGTSGPGQAVPLTDDTGYFWFFNADNVEMVLKVLDACATPFNRFWVFAGGLTNVEVDILVEDTLAGASQTYRNPLETPFQPIQDTNAFATCP